MTYNNKKIGIIGGDGRQKELAKALSKLGFEVGVWGLGEIAENDGAVKCPTPADAVKNSAAVILPLPVSRDGENIFTPLEDGGALSVKELIKFLPRGITLIGGKFCAEVKAEFDKAKIKYVDYFELEEFQIKNALPTAEGAIAIAINAIPKTLFGANTAVTGYGRISRVLSQMLKTLGANVTVAARKSSALAWSELYGYSTLKIESYDGESSLSALADGYDIIFNTVPFVIFDRKVLSGFSKKTVIIDLASLPGGVDEEAADEYGIKLIRALSLPGKTAPETAGKIVSECVIDILEREAIIG